MKTITHEIKVYDINDIKNDETLKSNVLDHIDANNYTFDYSGKMINL